MSLETVALKETLAAAADVAADGVTSIDQFTAEPQSLSFTLFFAVHAPSTADSEVPSSPLIAAPTYSKFVVLPLASPGALYPITVQEPAAFLSEKKAS